MESKKINQLATELAPELSDLTIIGDPTTGISKKITLSQMASLFTGTVEEYANLASFPLVGTADTIYIALDTNIIYRWNTGTSAYVELSPNIVTSLVFSDANGFDGTISLVGSTATLTITTALTQGSVPFIGASGALSQDNANLFFDDTNNRLGINTNTPTTALDVFGSGIIGRLNGTSTNNAFLGFASAGSNKWSIGNVQSDHRFRIYNEATTSELVSVLQTGEFGIGIANPLTKLHIFGGASALIANLDANTSVAKSISFRSGNSSRINLEVSGTESGSNAGMDFFIRRYSDAGALIDTPFTITRSTGNATFVSRVLAGSSSNTTNAFSGANNSLTEATLYLSNSNASGWSIYSNQGVNYFGGNVGILTTTPAAPLDVVGNTIIRSMSGTALNLRGDNTLNSDFGITWTTTTYTGGIAAIRVARRGATDASDMMFYTAPNGNTPQERLRITSTGNIGIGVTNPSAKLNLIGGELRWGFTSDMGALSYTDNKPMLASVGALDFLFYTNGAERMRISSSGSVGIGEATPSSLLHVNRNTATNQTTAIINQSGAGGNGNQDIGLIVNIQGANDDDRIANFRYYDGSTYASRFLIKRSGYVGVNTTTPQARFQINGAGGSELALQLNDGSTRRCFFIPSQYYGYMWALEIAGNGGKAWSFGAAGGGGEVGTIVVNASSTAYNTTSDYRLKEDLKDFNGLELLSKVKVYDFKWKKEDARTHGVMAHELQEVLPYAVSGEKDALNHEGKIEAQSVDYSKIVPMLVKAIQEQQSQIEELKALINK